MTYILAMVFIMTVALYSVTSGDHGAVVEQQLDGQAIGSDLLRWHIAASLACVPPPATPGMIVCPNGPVSPLSVAENLPSMYVGHGRFGNGAFQSYSYGGNLASYYVAPYGGYGGGGANYSLQANAQVVGYLMSAIPQGLNAWVGLYSTYTQQVSSAQAVYVQYAPPGLPPVGEVIYAPPVWMPASGYSASPVPNGAPIVVSPLP